MRLMTAISEVGPRVGDVHGTGWAVAFGDDPDVGVKHLVANFREHDLPRDSTLLVDEVGADLMVVTYDTPRWRPPPYRDPTLPDAKDA